MNRTRRAQLVALAIGVVVTANAAIASGTASAGVDAAMGPLKTAAVDQEGVQSTSGAEEPSISANGRYVTYTSRDTTVVGIPQKRSTQVFRYDIKTGKTILVSATPNGRPGRGNSGEATMSADGSVIVFATAADNLVPGLPLPQETIVARDVRTGVTTVVSQTPDGVPTSGHNALVSDDGSVVGFRTYSTDITGVAGAVIYDRTTGQSSAVTVQTSGDPLTVDEAWLSGDGAWVVFASSNGEIVPGDDNGTVDVFLLNLATGAVTLVSRSPDGTPGNGFSRLIATLDPRTSPKPFASTDGSKVVFMSKATDLAGAEGPNGDYEQTYVFDVASATSELVTVMPDGSASDDLVYAASISPDGRYAVVSTQAFLVGGGGGLGPKVYVRDLQRDETRAASDNGWGLGVGLGGGRHPYVTFTTYADLADGDTDGKFDPYYRQVW